MMRPGYDESPFNPLPPVIWALALPVIAAELLFFLGDLGLLGGASGAGMRSNALQMTAWRPEILQLGLTQGIWPVTELYRLVTYPFINYNFAQAAFVVVFVLALGKAISTRFSQPAIAALFFGAAIGGALLQTLWGMAFSGSRFALVGGFPAAYGLIGAFTWLLRQRLKAQRDDPARAFLLIGFLVLCQATFAVIEGRMPLNWVADLGGFACGFGLSFVVSPGGWRRLRRLPPSR